MARGNAKLISELDDKDKWRFRDELHKELISKERYKCIYANLTFEVFDVI
jgi:hypothetical protein